ncbi:pyruvate kinase-like protein [Xylariomycetidae sp. FL2044]|nr:pyruvate kinase-like protein [Xylariomycetidae sp. FL2044]
MEVVAVSNSKPTWHDVHGMKLYTSIVHTPLTSPADYIEVNESGVAENQPAVHDGPVYIAFAENYDYWCKELGIDRESWGWCHWGENLSLRFKDPSKIRLEDEIHLGDVWKVGKTVRLEVCGSRVPCLKLAWRCRQKETWLKTLADSGRVGVYLRVLSGGRIHPGDEVVYESFSKDHMDVGTITRISNDGSLRTRDTLNLLANHKLLLRMNRFYISRTLLKADTNEKIGKNSWKGWRDFRPYRIVDEGGDVKSFYLRPLEQDQKQQQQPQQLAYYLPGQFLSVKLPHVKNPRNWTISDWPTQGEAPSHYRISIKRGGEASDWMHDHCTTDTVLPLRSPAGRFSLDLLSPIAPRQIYFSAGIGITPILAMMKAHASHPWLETSPALWIHVARDGAHFPLRDEVPAFRNQEFRKIVIFTKPRPEDVEGVDYHHRGRPDLAHLGALIGEEYTWAPLGGGVMPMKGNFSFAYICGPPAFERSVRDLLLRDLEFKPPQVHSESFSASSSGALLGGDVTRARVRFARSNVTATWTRDKPVSLLELAESVGLAPDHGCRVGACGSCVTKLTCGSVSGGVQMDGTILTCSATPASEDVEVEL